MVVPSGSQLGPYEVLGLLGSGGMGEVYRARDPRLDREVAIKVLPEEIANRDRLRRFEQEARAAGALNHPNVLAVHDIGTHDGAPYVVSELLEGHTLGARLDGGALPVRTAVGYAVQIADGLAAAHDKGIVHRDLKPDNVFLTEDGRAKILDFGLAKLTRPAGLLEADGERTATKATESGTVLGTVGYMSPEQVRGEEVDPRSDIFSFGAVLYEMLSGRRAFRGATPAETLAAILKEDPPTLSETGRAIPPGLARVVQRCLEKRPGDRFQSAHDLALALEAISSGVGGFAPLPLASRRRLVWASAVMALVALGAVAVWVTRLREPEPPSGPLRIRPLTSTPGEEWDPALSPDGTLLAFLREGASGQNELCVKQVHGSGKPLVLASGERRIFTPAWSADGQQIAFIRHVEAKEGAPNDGVFVISALGGPARLLHTLRSLHGLSWSPDGTLLAVSHGEDPEGPHAIHLLSAETGELRRLTNPSPGDSGDYLPQFSPDGRTVAFARAEKVFDEDLFLVPAEGGAERRLTNDNNNTYGLAWTPDGKDVVFSSWRPGGMGSYNLWRVPVSGGEPEILEFGGHGQFPTIARAGGRLAFQKAEMNQEVWRVGGPTAPEEDQRTPTRFIASTRPDLHARYSPDGLRIAFISERSGAWEIWLCEGDGSSAGQLTFLEGGMTSFPAWSPDSAEIAFTTDDAVFVVNASGGLPRRLTADPAMALASSWSRDGRWVYFYSSRTGSWEVWKVAVDGGETRQVTTEGGTWAFESRDGQFLYFGKSNIEGGPPGIWRMPRDGGEEVQVQDRASASLWALWDEGIVYIDFDPEPTLELFDLATGKVRPLATAEHCCAPGLSVSPDGRWVLYSGVERSEADILLVEGFR